MNGPAAGERAIWTHTLPNRVQLTLWAGHHGHSHRPIGWKAARGGRVVMARTPWGAYRGLLRFERTPLGPT